MQEVVLNQSSTNRNPIIFREDDVSQKEKVGEGMKGRKACAKRVESVRGMFFVLRFVSLLPSVSTSFFPAMLAL